MMPLVTENLISPTEEGPTRLALNPLDQLLGYQLRRASLAMLTDLTSALADIDLRVTDASILLVIHANPDITQSEIGRILAIQRANMVPLTASLIRRKLVRRASSKGRAHALRLTPPGKLLAEDCQRRIAAHEGKFLSAVSNADRDALVSQIRMIWSNDTVNKSPI